MAIINRSINQHKHIHLSIDTCIISVWLDLTWEKKKVKSINSGSHRIITRSKIQTYSIHMHTHPINNKFGERLEELPPINLENWQTVRVKEDRIRIRRCLLRSKSVTHSYLFLTDITEVEDSSVILFAWGKWRRRKSRARIVCVWCAKTRGRNS